MSVLEAAEHTFDLVAMAVGAFVKEIGFRTVAFIRNDGQDAAPFQPDAQGGAIIGLVGEKFFWRGQRFKQRDGRFAIIGLACTEDKVQGATFTIDYRMDFCGTAAPADAERLILAPFLPRAARCAFMAVLSMLFS